MSVRAFAQEPAADDTQNTEQPKEAEPSPSTMAPPPVAAPAATQIAAPAGPPKVGDVSVSGYFRGGYGASNQKGRMTCFSLPNPTSLVSKYRLGNECEVWSETHFTMVTYVGDDGVVARLHFMPTIYIPTTNIGYSPNNTVNSPSIFTTSTGATVSFPNLYVDIKGISWLGGGTAWMGTRYYKRESVYISDFFYWNPSGVGGGVEDIELGRDLRLSVAVFAVDGDPATQSDPMNATAAPLLPVQFELGFRTDLQLRGIKFWESGEFQLGFQYIANFSNDHDPDTGNAVSTTGGWGATLQFVQKLLGGDLKLVAQYGRGGGTGFGTLSRFYYPDFSLTHNPIEYRLRLLGVMTIQPTETIGGQFVAMYQHDGNFLGVTDSSTDWVSYGGRLSWGPLKYAKLVGEIGYDGVTKTIGSDPQKLVKFTIAPTISAGRGLLSRPELRLFYTYAIWNEAARGAGVDSGNFYKNTQFLSGSTFGLQAETWW